MKSRRRRCTASALTRRSEVALLIPSVMLSAVASSASTPVAQNSLPFIADDYDRARAEASRRHVPLFVEVWAPW